MKNEIQLILEEIKNIEESKNTEIIMQDEIAKICEKHGTTFEEFRNSVLKILADEIGISIDELESLSFKKISEENLMNISGGASQMQRITAASLAAILGCNTFINSHTEAIMGGPNKQNANQGTLAGQDNGFSKKSVDNNPKIKWLAGLGILTVTAIIGMPTLKKLLTSSEQNNYEEKIIHLNSVLLMRNKLKKRLKS